MNWQRVIWQRGTFPIGDFIPHSIRWEPRCQVQGNAAFLEDVIDGNGLEIENDGRATHHWTRDGHEGESVIDLMVANRPITGWSILADDRANGSDHEVIEWELEADRQEDADDERVVVWHLAALTEEDVEAAEKLWME